MFPAVCQSLNEFAQVFHNMSMDLLRVVRMCTSVCQDFAGFAQVFPSNFKVSSDLLRKFHGLCPNIEMNLQRRGRKFLRISMCLPKFGQIAPVFMVCPRIC